MIFLFFLIPCCCHSFPSDLIFLYICAIIVTYASNSFLFLSFALLKFYEISGNSAHADNNLPMSCTDILSNSTKTKQRSTDNRISSLTRKKHKGKGKVTILTEKEQEQVNICLKIFEELTHNDEELLNLENNPDRPSFDLKLDFLSLPVCHIRNV